MISRTLCALVARESTYSVLHTLSVLSPLAHLKKAGHQTIMVHASWIKPQARFLRFAVGWRWDRCTVSGYCSAAGPFQQICYNLQ